MRSTLKAVGLVVVGYLLAVYFQFQVNITYAAVHQGGACQRQFVLSAQPYHEMAPINLFEKQP